MAKPQLPYRFISGLPSKAQQEIWRDFEYLAASIPSGTKAYDAYVDPLATADNTSTRVFTTIFAAVKYVCDTLGQTWCNIGVFVPTLGSNPVTITETGNYGGANVAFVQIDAIGAALEQGIDGLQGFGGSQHGAVNWELSSFTDSSKWGRIQIRGLFINTNIAAPGGPFTNASAEMVLQSCHWNANGHARFIAGNSTGRPVFMDCSMQGPSFGGAAAIVLDGCYVNGTLAAESWAGSVIAHNTRFSNIGSSTFTGPILMLDGCSFTQYSSGTSLTMGTLTCSNAATMGVFINSSGEEQALVQGLTLVVSAAIPYVKLDGRFWSITVAGPGPGGSGVNLAAAHSIVAHCEHSFDITGPATILVSSEVGGNFLRGEAIVGSAYAAASANSGVGLSFVGVKDSVILATFQSYAAAGTGQAYTIDAASTHNTIITAGAQLLPVSSTNSSTTTIVINETALFPSDRRDLDPALLIPPLGVVTIPAPVTAAASTRADMDPTWLSPLVAGMATIPVAAPGSAPTGPAGGSLNGSYPNPIFVGRSTSVDGLNQDMTQAILVQEAGVVTYPPLVNDRDLDPALLIPPLGVATIPVQPGVTDRRDLDTALIVPVGFGVRTLPLDETPLAFDARRKDMDPALIVPAPSGLWTPDQGSFGQVKITDNLASQGALYGSPEDLRSHYLKPASSYETFSRTSPPPIQVTVPTALGTIFLTAVVIPKHFLVTNIIFIVGAAVVTPTHWWLALCDNTFTTLRSSADKLTTAQVNNTFTSVALSSTFRTTYEGVYYIAYLQAGTTVGTSYGSTGLNFQVPSTAVPRISLTGNTAQTVPLADGTLLATAPVSATSSLYAYVQ